MESNSSKSFDSGCWSARCTDAYPASTESGDADGDGEPSIPSASQCAATIVPVTAAKSGRPHDLVATVARHDQVLIVTHDNPDPDAIASGWAIKTLLESCQPALPVWFVAGGQIARAENRHMVERLDAPIELVSSNRVGAYLASRSSTAIVLVDCGVNSTNHLASTLPQVPTAVIDHHRNRSDTRLNADNGAKRAAQRTEYEDVRPEIAACATIAASYLQQQQIVPSRALATALVYALKTETRGGENHFSPLDCRMLHWLTGFSDPGVLAEIEDAPLSQSYFLELVIALQNTVIYGDSAFCIIPSAESSEIVGEVADLLIRCRNVNSVFCGTAFGSDVLISVRADGVRDDATKLIHETLAGIGSGGGHLCRAGGKMSGVCLGNGVPADVEDELRTRWLAATCMADNTPFRLVPGQELISQLR